MLLLHKEEKKISRHKEMHTNYACYNPAILIQQFLLVGHPTTPVFHSQSPYFVNVYRNKQSKIFNYPSTFYSLCELLLSVEKFSCRRDEKNWKGITKGNWYHQSQGSHFQEVAALSLRNSLPGSRSRTTNTDVFSEGNTPPSKPHPLRTLV